MNLENQVVSLELSKRLKELGVKQESLYFWRHGNIAGWYLSEARDTGMEQCAAFTVAELGESIMYGNSSVMPPWYEDGEWKAAPGYKIHEETEADARASLLIYLIENHLITLIK